MAKKLTAAEMKAKAIELSAAADQAAKEEQEAKKKADAEAAFLKKDLTPDEQNRLNKLTADIKAGVNTFVTVGAALRAVQTEKLYRAHGTFEDYCMKEFGLAGSSAYDYITALGVSETLTKAVEDKVLTKEQTERLSLSQAIEIAKIGKPKTEPKTDEDKAKAEKERAAAQVAFVKKPVEVEGKETNVLMMPVRDLRGAVRGAVNVALGKTGTAPKERSTKEKVISLVKNAVTQIEAVPVTNAEYDELVAELQKALNALNERKKNAA